MDTSETRKFYDPAHIVTDVDAYLKATELVAYVKANYKYYKDVTPASSSSLGILVNNLSPHIPIQTKAKYLSLAIYNLPTGPTTVNKRIVSLFNYPIKGFNEVYEEVEKQTDASGEAAAAAAEPVGMQYHPVSLPSSPGYWPQPAPNQVPLGQNMQMVY